MKEVLNGGYNVHPVPPPNSEIKERITKRYERERIKIEKLFTLGYTTSGDPFWTRTRWKGLCMSKRRKITSCQSWKFEKENMSLGWS